jgi:hypothetical protein
MSVKFCIAEGRVSAINLMLVNGDQPKTFNAVGFRFSEPSAYCDFNLPERIFIMKKQLLLTSLLVALIAPVMAQSTSSAPQNPSGPAGGQDRGDIRRDQRDINQDRRDVRRDERQLNEDRRERNVDQRKEDQAIKRGDTKDAQKFEARREGEQREINKDKRDIAKDRADLRSDRHDRNQDVERVERHRR